MENVTSITIPPTQDIELTGRQLLDKAHGLEVVDNDSLNIGDKLLSEIKSRVSLFRPGLDEKCREADNLHSFLTTLRRKALEPYANAESEVKRKMGDYSRQQEEKRQREIEKANQKALKEAEEARQKAILAAKKAGDVETARELKNAPLTPQVDPSALKVEAVPKLEKTSFRYEWDFEIVNPDLIPRRFMVPDESAIRKVVRALGKECGIDGIVVTKRTVTINRG